MLSEVPGVTFRRIPDPSGDSCTFLSWFLPTEEQARSAVAELKSKNVLAGNFYWYDNNWHYIKKWNHLKDSVTLNALHPELKAAVLHHASKDFSASDAVMGRCISTLINLSWTEQQLKEKGQALVAAAKSALKREPA
jgi:8-amino-3,8-dideoxy-alpha-D-manno-octulosonate transaminase